MSVSLSTPTIAGDVVLRIGRELHIDVVGTVDDVIVGDDVATVIDDVSRAERATRALVRHGTAGDLAAEEAVEEVLHVALVSAALFAFRRLGLRAATVLLGRSLLGQRFGVDVHHCGPNLLDDGREAIREIDRIRDHQWARIAGVHLLLLGAYRAREHGSGHDADGENCKKAEGGGQVAAANPGPQGTAVVPAGLIGCFHFLFSSSSFLAGLVHRSICSRAKCWRRSHFRRFLSALPHVIDAI
jgi:hypothetical protein